GLSETLRLSGLKVRGAVLDLEVHGRGDRLVELRVDGRRWDAARAVPYPPPGPHTIALWMQPSAGEVGPGPFVLSAGDLPQAEPRPLDGPAVARSVTVPYNESSGNIEVALPSPGRWSVSARYANGAGPINTDSRCALRAARVDGRRAGVLVM